ncbi:MAG: carboxypeptidase regulatory-like domain-containing protein, partial [Blastocatellia bacterium]|nr:carboxypeptidase regulatory-like domain-containing protein [Blastocatellia bacterium]
MWEHARQTGSKLACQIALVVLSMVMLTSGIWAQSQASTGQISGHITDSTGAAVAGAEVKAINDGTGLTQTVTTNQDGIFRIVLLPTGTYTLTVTASGFATATATKAQVLVGRTLEVNLTLTAGGQSEVVEVSAGAVAVQTTRSEADAVQNEVAINTLPINGRRFQDFVTLTPAAQVNPQRGQISLSGQRGINGNVNIDGLDYNQGFFGGIRGGERSNNAFTVPQESIKEFQVVAAGYSAEFGRSTGGLVNAVTKSGSNEFHGSAFYLNRNKSLSRSNAFFDQVSTNLRRKVVPAPTQQQFGGSIGGPIKKNKAFFFFAYEQQKLENERATVFNGIANLTPAPTSVEAFNFYTSQQGVFKTTNDAISLTGRFDYEINPTNRFNIRYSFSDNEAINANSAGNAIFPTTVSALSNNGTEKDRTNTLVGQYTSFFTNSMVNEMRAQYSRERRPRGSNSALPTVNNAIGNFGAVNFLPNEQFDWRAQVADNITWTKGNHTIKFGGEFNHVYAEQLFGFNQFGNFSFRTTDVPMLLDILSVGGTVANRFDSTLVNYDR